MHGISVTLADEVHWNLIVKHFYNSTCRSKDAPQTAPFSWYLIRNTSSPKLGPYTKNGLKANWQKLKYDCMNWTFHNLLAKISQILRAANKISVATNRGWGWDVTINHKMRSRWSIFFRKNNITHFQKTVLGKNHNLLKRLGWLIGLEPTKTGVTVCT